MALIAFYAMAAAAFALNAAAIGAVVRGWVRSTPLLHTAVMLASWMLYQGAFRVFTDQETSPEASAASPWAPACGFCPLSLRFDPGENSRICTGFIGSVERWMVLPWQFPWSGGNRTASAGAGGRADLTAEPAFVWWPTFAGCILGFAIGAFADVVRRMMRRMQQRVRRRHFRRRARRV
ncbi:hypothetical protein PVAP13_6KG249100 [Panicum virgatum]|uniref:Uncharacterized protein n=1 Tax=Panicum virgatum TaxID=38727 RepID=A0A8T0RFR6_PANVG|nr:hypothetical protein PVAP13_6KG249100 [Panicum virgatum]